MNEHKPQADIERLNVAIVQFRKPTVGQLGGRLNPTAEMRSAKMWVEVIQRPPVALEDSELLASHGWLSPGGELYGCGWKCHTLLNEALGFKHESDIEGAGYCKLSELRWLVQRRYCTQGLTADQWATIQKWYARNGYPEEHFIRLGTMA